MKLKEPTEKEKYGCLIRLGLFALACLAFQIIHFKSFDEIDACMGTLLMFELAWLMIHHNEIKKGNKNDDEKN